MDSKPDDQSADVNETSDSVSTEDYQPRRSEGKPISSRWDLQERWTELEEAAPTDVEKGKIVTGIVVAIEEQYIVVDVGAKFEGVIARNEFSADEQLPAENEEIEVAVVHVDQDKGMIVLSKKRANYERAWQKLYEARDSGEVLTAMVSDRVKGGLRVDVGMPGFVPASQVAIRDVRQLDKLIGKTLRLKVLEVNRARNQIILSHRQVIEEERQRCRQETLARLHEGVVCEGRVRNLTNYGAFVDLGGVDGLLHISEMSWTYLDHPSDVVKTGEIIRVMVLSIQDDGQRISLGRRQILPNPWKQAGQELEEGSMVEAVITRVVATGAFARLPKLEVEGFIPLREISAQRITKADEVLTKGQKVRVKVLDLNPEAHKMALSVVGAEAEQDRQEYAEYMKSQQASTIKLGDHFGEALKKTKETIINATEADAAPPEAEDAAPLETEDAAPLEAEDAAPPEAEDEALPEAEDEAPIPEEAPVEEEGQPEAKTNEEAVEAESAGVESQDEESDDAPQAEAEDQEES